MERKWITLLTISGLIIVTSFTIYQATKLNYHNEVILDSDIVEFSYVSLNKTIDNVTVSWLFHNIAGRMLNLSITAEFYDRNGNILFSKTNELLKFPADYTEHLLLPANKISYNGKYASKVDYVILHVKEE